MENEKKHTTIFSSLSQIFQLVLERPARELLHHRVLAAGGVPVFRTDWVSQILGINVISDKSLLSAKKSFRGREEIGPIPRSSWKTVTGLS